MSSLFKAFIVSSGGSFIVISVLKIFFSSPRPDLLSRCGKSGDQGQLDSLLASVTQLRCPGDSQVNGLIRDGWMSFPSGHSAVAMSAAVTSAVYLFAHLPFRGRVNRVWLVAAPVFLAGLIMASRVKDNRHHPEDVLAGGLVAVCMATIGALAFQKNAAAQAEDYEQVRFEV